MRLSSALVLTTAIAATNNLLVAATEQQDDPSLLPTNKQLNMNFNGLTFTFAGISITPLEAPQSCPSQYASLLQCLTFQCPGYLFNDACNNVDVTAGDPVTCTSIEESMCWQHQSSGCCLSNCQEELRDTAVCIHDQTATAEDLIGSCEGTIECGVISTQEQEQPDNTNNELLTEFFLEVLPGIIADTAMALNWCPLTWASLGTCLAQKCPTFLQDEACQNNLQINWNLESESTFPNWELLNISSLFPTELQNWTDLSALATQLSEFSFCESIGTGLCTNLGENGCCLSACVTELQQVSACALQDVTGIPFSCPAVECAFGNYTNTTFADTQQPFAELGEFLTNLDTTMDWSFLQFGADDILNSTILESECPSQFGSWIQCVVQDCPNVLSVCGGGGGGDADSSEGSLELTGDGFASIAQQPNFRQEATCENLRSNICTFVSGEDCCLTNCLSQTQAVATCIQTVMGLVNQELNACDEISCSAISPLDTIPPIVASRVNEEPEAIKPVTTVSGNNFQSMASSWKFQSITTLSAVLLSAAMTTLMA